MDIPDKIKDIQEEYSNRVVGDEIFEAHAKDESSEPSNPDKSLSRPRRKYQDSQLLQILRREAKRLDGTPTVRHFRDSADLPSPTLYQKRWGSWSRAIKEAGLEPNKRGRKADVNKK